MVYRKNLDKRKQFCDFQPDFEEELEPEEKEKRKEMKLYDDAAIKSDDDGNKAPASDIEKESDWDHYRALNGSVKLIRALHRSVTLIKSLL